SWGFSECRPTGETTTCRTSRRTLGSPRACPSARSDINRPAPASSQRSRPRSLITLLEHLSNPSERYGHNGCIKVAAHKPSSFAHQGRRHCHRGGADKEIADQVARFTKELQ